MLADVLTLSVDVPEPVTDAGLKVAVAAGGRPLAASVTEPVKPFTALIVPVYAVLPPWGTFCDPGEAMILKSDVPLTTNDTCAMCWRVPLVAVMVMR